MTTLSSWIELGKKKRKFVFATRYRDQNATRGLTESPSSYLEKTNKREAKFHTNFSEDYYSVYMPAKHPELTALLILQCCFLHLLYANATERLRHCRGQQLTNSLDLTCLPVHDSSHILRRLP